MESLGRSYIDIYYAEAILQLLPNITQRHCDGCVTKSLSQRHHTCLGMTFKQRLALYFNDILTLLNDNDVVAKCQNAMPTMSDVKLESPIQSEGWKDSMLKKCMQLYHLQQRM